MQVARLLLFSIVAVSLSGCNGQSPVHRTLREAGPETLRKEMSEVCRDAFTANRLQKIPKEQWPAAVRRFHPLGIWAEPDGAYILLDSDADRERGIFIPRILSEKDPVCGPTLTHEKLAEGVYSYQRKR